MTEINQPGGSGGSALEVSDGSTNVLNVTEIVFSGAVVTNGGGGIADVAISGTGLTFETPTGTVDNSNMTFTVSNTPLYIIVNGLAYTAGKGVFASYAGGTITLNTPVGSGGFILSVH